MDRRSDKTTNLECPLPRIVKKTARCLFDLWEYKAFPLKNTSPPIKIGRAQDSDILLPDSAASRTHAILTVAGENQFIRDANSTHGTLINGKPTAEAVLKHNDIIQIGTTLLKFFQVPIEEQKYLPMAPPADPDPDMIGYGFEWRKLIQQIRTYGPTSVPILIHGPTGAGKELVARSIVSRSLRAKSVFRTYNISAVSQSLLESTLFGHEKGAFTGATAKYPGIIKESEGGTLFLDEIGDLPIPLQSKLLRSLQFREIQPIGGNVSRVDVRFIAATNRDILDPEVIRPDLIERFGGQIRVVPLYERKEDLQILMNAFIKREKEISSAFFIPAVYYPWKGNIRSLEFTMKNAVLLAGGDSTLQFEHLPQEIQQYYQQLQAGEIEPELSGTEPVSKKRLMEALTESQGKVKQAAIILRCSRSYLYKLIEEYRIDVNSIRYRKKEAKSPHE